MQSDTVGLVAERASEPRVSPCPYCTETNASSSNLNPYFRGKYHFYFQVNKRLLLLKKIITTLPKIPMYC